MAPDPVPIDSAAPSVQRAWYRAAIEEFVATEPTEVLRTLLQNSTFDIQQTQREAWRIEAVILSKALSGLRGGVYFEFSIPRMGRRIDAVVIVGGVVFALEFKVGESGFDQSAIEQVWDYALDLKNFHAASHAVAVVPVLIATEAKSSEPIVLTSDPDGVYRPLAIATAEIRDVMNLVLARTIGPAVGLAGWYAASYCPTPTIVEAARALYAQHSVEAIARFDAGAKNLRETSRRIDVIVDAAMRERRKVICFVTGVPGAGKTLVGLNVATRHRRELDQPTHAVFLSGNGPLVDVLREALARDEVKRGQAEGRKVRIGEARERVKAFIQNVHHFRDEALVDTNPPAEHVVIFDEAQRAWNREQTANFMRQKKGQPGFDQSEPEFLISYLDRHRDWAVIVALVGGGQEINTGEAGITAWLDAVRVRFPGWHLAVSSRLTDSEYAAGHALDQAKACRHFDWDDSLHLAVSMRSFRAENVSSFVKALLDCDAAEARRQFETLKKRFPIVVTRDLSRAKQWVREKARGSERYGVVASSKAMRLKPLAIDIRVNTDPVQWFLNERDNTRSSYYLEDAATEFQVQGLELDWACVVWDGDFRYSGGNWSYHDFRGSKWVYVQKPERQVYLKNAYRVLLTRARQGMVIVVPEGDQTDATRVPEFYRETFAFLTSVGVSVLQ